MLSQDRCLRRTLRRYKRHGFLGSTTKLRDEDLTRLCQVLTDYEPQSLYSSSTNDTFHLIVDTGCSHSATGCVDDFIPNTLVTLETPLEMAGIAGGLLIRQKGRVRYELLTDGSSGIRQPFHHTQLRCNHMGKSVSNHAFFLRNNALATFTSVSQCPRQCQSTGTQGLRY
jgi:hypothetical protein